MFSATMVAMLGVLLLSLLGLSQGDVYPFPTTAEQARIRQGIKDGVVGNEIVFGVLQDQPPVTRANVCNKITNIHNTRNAEWLGAAHVTLMECNKALTTPLKYNTVGELDDWSGEHHGTWTSDSRMNDNLLVKKAVTKAGPIFYSDIDYSNRGICCGYIEAGPNVCCLNTYDYLHVLLQFHRFLSEDMIQRT